MKFTLSRLTIKATSAVSLVFFFCRSPRPVLFLLLLNVGFLQYFMVWQIIRDNDNGDNDDEDNDDDKLQLNRNAGKMLSIFFSENTHREIRQNQWFILIEIV